jgi:hypothetical protein
VLLPLQILEESELISEIEDTNTGKGQLVYMD